MNAIEVIESYSRWVKIAPLLDREVGIAYDNTSTGS
jgi:hypothetical protein